MNFDLKYDLVIIKKTFLYVEMIFFIEQSLVLTLEILLLVPSFMIHMCPSSW